MKVTKQRSALKAVSWRAIGTADTFIVSYLITHRPITAASIAGFEVLTKTFLYYLHERGWNNVSWGRINDK
ncbi:unannotated protein [freshwater metagenome]|uniref:Unannotated protein n=1 Tax=freshwater metagenome TaxID=449393 RepID=A0A6J7MRF8_9ZZZZ|nr:DUF2061 domain-containing protein [Actinomycetota bacterium]MSX90210.1 DUF2061 domain-containing protein [Actinomycetota bacterium]MSZ64052.1 DUF2061 domain-containing protein [Actinomycetota bacterium]MTA57346.1 DUF2061 domain-containing protein [Actinomycetota bacterium]